jgi:perosamine synthetase
MTFRNPFKPIAIGLSPNASGEDVRLALSLLLSPSRWVEGDEIAALEERFRRYLKVRYACTFDSGRSSLYALLSCLGIGAGDEVLLQAYTCVVVPNAVLWCGARPRYVDIDEHTLNMDVADLARKITPRSRAIIVQHTFGHVAPMDEIIPLARGHGLAVIEDCAHALGSEIEGRKAGTLGAAAFFSFGRDKVISSVHGGLAVTDDPHLGGKLERFQAGLPFPPRRWVAQQLLHPLACSLMILPTYELLHLGKVLLVVMQRLGLLSLAVTGEEKRGGKPAMLPARMPNGLAALALSQMGRLERFNEHRRAIARTYSEMLEGSDLQLPVMNSWVTSTFMRYTVQTPRAAELYELARRHRIILGNWYCPAIAPRGTEPSKVFYEPGSCPVAERAAERSLNLPTYPNLSLDDARRIARLILKGANGEKRHGMDVYS